MYKAGDIVVGCRLLTECGSGAFGSVFLAENETTHRRVALKILPKSGRNWGKELAALIVYQEKCRHASLMRIYHIGQNDDCIFYTMDAADPLNREGEYVPDTLGNRLRRKKRLEPETIRRMLEELLEGLENLHNAGLLHRDIKPDNVLWVDGHAELGDIGLVTEAAKASFAGTRGFISPAVWKGERGYEARDDLYALAMTLYCALTGNEPKGNLELPLSLTLSGCGDLIRAYNAVLDEASPIRSVADFRTVWRKAENGPRGCRRKRFLFAGFFVLLSAAVGLVFLFRSLPTRSEPRLSDLNGPDLPPLPSLPRTPAEIRNIRAAGTAVQKLYRDRRTAIRQAHREPPELLARLLEFERLKKAMDAAYWRRGNGMPVLDGLGEAELQMAKAVDPKNGEAAWRARRQIEIDRSEAFLGEYPPWERAAYRYCFYREKVFQDPAIRQDIPDTLANREVFARDFREWQADYRKFLAAEQALLKRLQHRN